MASRKRDLWVEVLRNGTDGHVFSRIIDRNRPDRLSRKEGVTYEVVIDRQRGRQLDAETVQRRAEYLADLVGIPIEIDLQWPCIAALGQNHCRCPQCVKKHG